jgi:hypothetical protein
MMCRMLIAVPLAMLLIACSKQDDQTLTVAPRVEVETTQQPTSTAEPTLIATRGTPQAVPGTMEPTSVLPDGAGRAELD